MTNQSSDTQPALHSHNVSVRAGRLTKFKGQVASIAPGLLVVATAAVLFSGGAVHADNECGPDEVGQDIVICEAPTGTGPNPYADGITYTESDGLTLILDDSDIEVGGSGVSVVGSTSGEGYISVHLGDGDVQTSGDFAHGLLAWTSGRGAALAQMEGGTVTTGGVSARGLFALIENAESEAQATARLTDGAVETSGNNGFGLYARSTGLGTVLAQMEGGSVTTGAATGLFAEIANTASTAQATVRLGEGHVQTSGDFAHGVLAWTSGLGAALAQMEGGTVTTGGASAHGLWAQSAGGQAIVALGADAVVTASGLNADGIRAQGATGFDFDVAGSVTGGSGSGAAIRALSNVAGSGTIDIASTGKVMAGASGIAIQDGDGDAAITSAGTIRGDIHLGAGNDILNLTGGRFAGDIYAGDGDDTVMISATTEYDSSNILDGGAGDDRLTLHGQTLTTMANLTNWERITLNKTDLRLNTALSIAAGSEFRAFSGEGGMSIADGVTNAGDLTLSVQDGVAGNVIRIAGDYTGSEAISNIFALDTDGAHTDKLEITGDASGEMELLIASVAGAEGGPLEIDVVSVGGASDDATFTLIGGNHVTSDGEHRVIAGAYLYRLAETTGGWALSARSEAGEVNYQPSVPIYDSYGAALLSFNALSALRERGSSQDFRSLAWGGQGAQTSGAPLWIRMGTEQITSAAEQSTSGSARDSSLWEMEIGADLVLSDSAAGLFVGGLTLSYGTGSTDVSSDFGDGSIETSGLGLGLSATWYDARGFYVDGQVTVTSYSSDLSSDSLGSLIEGNSGTGYALSLEAGQQLDLGARLSVIPQAQLSLSSVTFNDFTGEAQGERVSLSDASSQQLRLGLEVAAQDQGASGLYGIVNLYHDFGSGSEVRVGATSLTSENEAWALGVGAGGRYAWSDRVDFFGEASYATGLSNAGETSALSASAGLRVVF